MLLRPWPRTETDSHPAAPAPLSLGGYGVYDPDLWKRRPRRSWSPLEFSIVLGAFALFMTFGLRPTIAVFAVLFEIAGELL